MHAELCREVYGHQPGSAEAFGDIESCTVEESQVAHQVPFYMGFPDLRNYCKSWDRHLNMYRAIDLGLRISHGMHLVSSQYRITQDG